MLIYQRVYGFSSYVSWRRRQPWRPVRPPRQRMKTGRRIDAKFWDVGCGCQSLGDFNGVLMGEFIGIYGLIL